MFRGNYCQIFLLLTFTGICFIGAFSSVYQNVVLDSYVDWPNRIFTFVVSTSVDQRRLPSSKQEAEGFINHTKNALISSLISHFPLDYWGSFISADKSLRQGFDIDLYKATQSLTKNYVTFSNDMLSVRVSYSLPFFEITKSIVRSDFHYIQDSLLPGSSFDYTGIVIDATSELPIKNKKPQVGFLKPSILPSLMSSDGRNLVTPYTVEDHYFKLWGTAGYSYDLDNTKWPTNRIGSHPIVIPGKSILGDNFNAIEIAEHYANMILANKQGVKTLLEGRVIFLIRETMENNYFSKSQKL